MTFLRLTSLFAAAALALAATAFGALTPSDYRAQANAACAKANAQMKALGLGKPVVNPTAAETAKSTAAGLAIGQQAYTSLRALQPPALLAAAHNRALWLLWKELALVTKDVEQMQAGADPIKVITATGMTGLKLALREAAAWGAAGVAVCSRGGFSIHT